MKVKPFNHHLRKLLKHLAALEQAHDDVLDTLIWYESITERANSAHVIIDEANCFKSESTATKQETPPLVATPVSTRCKEWNLFADKVAAHIEQYTVPQYGDAPNDQVENWTAEECLQQLNRYLARTQSNQRGEAETKRDFYKMAHYLQLAFSKCYDCKPQPAEQPQSAEHTPQIDYTPPSLQSYAATAQHVKAAPMTYGQFLKLTQQETPDDASTTIKGYLVASHGIGSYNVDGYDAPVTWLSATEFQHYFKKQFK